MDDDVATERPRTLDEIVAEQECVIAYRQARDLGLTDEYLEWKVNSGRWLWALRFRPEHVAGQLRRALGDQSAEIMELPVSAHG
jgi:hypothetical protein